MTSLVSRFSLRLLVPALAISTLAAFGEPITEKAAVAADPARAWIEVERQTQQQLALALHQEAETLRHEAVAAKKAASRTAAQMRWFLTLPAAGNGRGPAPAPVGAG